MSEFVFDKKFTFGAASAAFQIEGGYDRDGKGLSIWDMFCRIPDVIFNNGDGKTACNSYELYREDVKLLKDLGADAYRFSTSWARVMPDGVHLNQKGIDYYRRLCDELTAVGIAPYVTLYHWDLPYELHCRGGLLNRDFSGWFCDYTQAVVKALGEDVKVYFTFNEPQSIVGAGYGLGTFAPGIKGGDAGCFAALHNMLLAHGDAARLLKSYSKQVGIVNCGDAYYPQDENDSQLREAVNKRLFEPRLVWSYVNVCDPIFLGDYCPEFYAKYPFEADKFIRGGDTERIKGNTDYCCYNHYSGDPLTFDGSGNLVTAEREQGYAAMSTGWAVDEKALYYTLKAMYDRYNKPIYITENGMACNDIVSGDGKVHDTARVEYFRRFLGQVKRIIDDGIDLRGYFAWSLLDNFEWLCGYSQRFGITYVDYNTCKRIPKDSYYYLRDLFSVRA